MHDRFSWVESFDWSNPFLCLTRREKREREKEQSRERKTGEKRKRKEKEKEIRRKMKTKMKIRPNIPNELITEYSYIFAPFFFLKQFEVQLHVCLFLN